MNLRRTLVVVSIVLLAQVAPAWAANTTCANREAMLVGSTDNWSIAASSSAYFATRLTAGRSYVFLAWTPFQDASETLGAVNLVLYSDTTCTTSVATTSVESEEPWSNLAAADIDAVGFIPSSSGQYVLQVQNLALAAISHRIMIFETSTYSPWWFVGGNNQAFITISNRSNVSSSVVVTMNDGAGAQCGQTTVSIPANGNTYVRVNDFPTCVTAVSGSAQLAFLGTPGTIQANTTVIDAVQGVSFDEPFTPRMAWSFQER